MDWFASLSRADNHRNGTLHLQSLQFRGKAPQRAHLHLVLLDSSGSTLNQRALAEAKGAVAGLAQLVYLAREQLALIQFGNARVEQLIKPGRAPKNLSACLDRITAGGGTPLREALLHAQRLLGERRRQHPAERHSLYLLTDGRSQDSVADLRLEAGVTVVDTECSRIKLGRARRLAKQLGATYYALDELPLTPG